MSHDPVIDTLLAASDAEILADVADPKAAAAEVRRIFERAAIEAAARAILCCQHNEARAGAVMRCFEPTFELRNIAISEATAAIRAYLAAQPAEATAAEMMTRMEETPDRT